MKRDAALIVTFKLLNFSTYNNCSKKKNLSLLKMENCKSLTFLLANGVIART